MKIENGKPEFTSITITLETQQEVDIFQQIGNYSGFVADRIAMDLPEMTKEKIKEIVVALYDLK